MNQTLLNIYRRHRGEKNIAGKNESIWNLFVQILLPLILILSFLSVLDILRYKTVSEIANKENKEYRKIIEGREKNDQNQQILGTNTQIIETQKYKLLKALEEVKYEERKRFKLVKFMNGEDVDLKDAGIADEDFKFLCNNIRENVSHSNTKQRQNYMNALYQKIFKRADVRDNDPSKSQVRKWHENIESTFTEVLLAKPGIISNENRASIQNKIIEFVNDLEQEVIELQSEVLVRILNTLMEKPEGLDESSRKLVMEILSPDIDLKTRENKANEFYREEMSKVKKRTREYHFLDETWNQIASIN
ncbi:hypothetical protein HY990_00075 [Candidatus Micrarchaeota archaeon]|nr:hypothetical protein [Candidatus Micrarchaeota archaeon]